MKLKLFVVLVVVALLASCSVNPSEVDKSYAKGFAAKITYVQDTRTGLCFGLVASRKTMDTDQNGLGMTTVPCEMVRGFLVNK